MQKYAKSHTPFTAQRRVLRRYPKKSYSDSYHCHLQWPLLAEFVELNIEEYLSEPEFHAESNNSGLIPPN